MNFGILAFGLLLILGGFVTLVRKVHDRSVQETLAQLTYARGDRPAAISAFAVVLAPIVSSIVTGVAILAVVAMRH
jgi:hypothetical protein